MIGHLTTHVLDTTHGKPASHLAIELWRIDAAHEQRTRLKTVWTTITGRPEQALLLGEEMQAGIYELDFSVGAYFAALGVVTTVPPFLDIVPIRFGLADVQAHYHVPLLISPWAYSTYRGS